MTSYPCVVLHHTLPGEPHYDWLMVDPRDPTGLLWAARTPVAPEAWLELRAFPIHPLPPHRRSYLTYEGPVSGGRGDVKRVAQGEHQPGPWTDHSLATMLQLAGLPPMRAAVQAVAAAWRCTVEPA